MLPAHPLLLTENRWIHHAYNIFTLPKQKKRRITMKRRILSGLLILPLFVVCFCFPSHAGNVTVKNNCGQRAKYLFYSNFYFWSWSEIGSGVLSPNSCAELNSNDTNACAVMVKLQWYPEEVYMNGQWVNRSNAVLATAEECPVSGCKWLQCGAAIYSLDLVGTPANPQIGDTRKCKLTKK